MWAQSQQAEYSDGYITFRGGGKMYYETYGHGTPIVFIHGHTLDRRMWAEQVKVLKDRYWVITPDSRGYGRSSDPEEGYQFTHADDIIDLMDSLHIEKAHIVGLSMGGFSAGDLLAMYPDRLLSSVMVSGELVGWSGPSNPKSAAQVAKEKKERHAFSGDDNAYKRRRANSLVNIGGSQRERMRDALTEIVMDWGLWQVKHSTCRVYYGNDGWRKFRKNPPTIPYIIIYGDKEKKSTYRSRMLDYAPQGKVVVVSDCGHMVNMERPEEFNQILLDWLAQFPSEDEPIETISKSDNTPANNPDAKEAGEKPAEKKTEAPTSPILSPSPQILDQVRLSDNLFDNYTGQEILQKYRSATFQVQSARGGRKLQGYGFFVSPDGIAVSDYSIFRNARDMKVMLPNGDEAQVSDILGYNTRLGYVIFKVKGSRFNFIPVSKAGCSTGDPLFTLITPQNASPKLGEGEVSGKASSRMIPIKMSSSSDTCNGAPLINDMGEAIGITLSSRNAIDIRALWDKE